ncbi:MAG: DNA topoisomerase IV subunit A [Bacilli bacterium]|nr:DNA topoisomerase IV subunit A [Bacilli bacterium]
MEETKETIKKIYDYSLEYIMGDSFGRYAKTIIQDRALPDVRDGLKPVQRRILYAMYKDGNTYDKPTKKSAKAVGNIMGFYHPHGDSSIYDAMVRMSQWWKNNLCYVEMQGNNGSMDGDGAAAMRYTEARLSKVAGELLKDINKDTVLMSLNYDDTLLEPTVLPAKFPNLLVNGATGISAGYATNIPPHNLGEIIDATIKKIDSPNCHLDTILDIVKGPDFPTGGVAEGIEGIKEAFKTGKGKVNVRCKYEIVGTKNKRQIIISEIPYEVNKATLVKKIDDIRIEKKVDGIAEVRDETDRNGLQIAIDLKKDANEDLIINYLLKNTDMMVSYNYNMVAIVNRRPMILGILEILDAYIEHLKEVITRRTEFDLKVAKARMHILEGLIKALSILDEVIKTIRASKNKADAIQNLQNEYDFTKEQAEAIVNLQLYKLTNTDVTELEEELKQKEKEIAVWTQILENEAALKHVMKTELKLVKKEYATNRKTEIKEDVTEIKIDSTSLIPKEDCMVIVTKEGYVKRVSKRSFTANSEEETGLKDKDYPIGIYEANTMDTLLVFTDLGNFLYIPVYELPDLKWKDLGKHLSNIIKITSDENIIASYLTKNFEENINFLTFTKNGMVKQTPITELKVQRYTKPVALMKLKGTDKIVSVEQAKEEIFITTNRGYGLRYKTEEVPITGLRGSGVKAINLKDDFIVSGRSYDEGMFVTIITDNGTAKRIKIEEFETTSRARKGVLVVRDVKTNPYHIVNSFITNNKQDIGILTDEINYYKVTDFRVCDRYQTGTQITKEKIEKAFSKIEIINDNEPEEINVSLDVVDEQIMTIDDFLDDLKDS